MPRKIPADLRKSVVERANHRCEYCLIWQDDSYDFFEIDHIRSVKHGGNADSENLAFSCPDCNAFKGADIGTYLTQDLVFTRLFNPRTDVWETHFEPLEGAIYPKTEIAEATIKILKLNDPDRVILRQELAIDHRWP